MDLKGKRAIVVGGVSGIGFETVKEFFRNNVEKVVVIDNDKNMFSEVSEIIERQYGLDRFHLIYGDVSISAELENAFRNAVLLLGSLDIVINNAAIINENHWTKCVGVNLNGVIQSTRLATQYMGNQGGRGGVIINTSSIEALDHYQMFPVYVGTKWAILGFTLSIASRYRYSDVRIMVLCPGSTNTTLLQTTNGQIPDVSDNDLEEMRELVEKFPFQDPESVAKCTAKMITSGENGSVWLATGGKQFVLEMPRITKNSYKLIHKL